jgi:hypothetical protein
MFGGWADPAGNWTYLLDESTPRPVAATIAVLASKLTGAKPLGKFYRPGGNVFHLFEKNGKPILVAASAAPRRTILNLGSGMVTFTDYQGNERTQAVANGPVALNLEPMGVFIEGGDLRVLQSYLTLSIGADRQPVEHPKVACNQRSAGKSAASPAQSLHDAASGFCFHHGWRGLAGCDAKILHSGRA